MNNNVRQSINQSIYIYIYKQRSHVRDNENVSCDASFKVLFIQDSKSTKFAFISKYQFIKLANRVNAYINFYSCALIIYIK